MATTTSIKNRALLINLAFHKPQMTKLDRVATQESEARHGSKGALRTQKLLYPKRLIDPIIAVEAEARNYLRNNALEWGTSGMYMLDTARYMDVRARLSEYELQRGQEVTKFAQNWAEVLAEAEAQQGDLFDASVYPDVSEVVSQFTTHLFVSPLGDMTPDMFTNIEDERSAQIAADVEKATREAVNGVVAQPVARMLEAILNLYDKTSRENTRIHDSIIEQLSDIVAMVPSLNVLDIPQLNVLAEACKKRLVVNGDMLRGKENADKRQLVSDDAKAILKAAGIEGDSLKSAGSQQDRKATAKAAADAIVDKLSAYL